MACSDENLASLLLKLSASRQVASIVGQALEHKLQPWLLSAQKCEEMLRCRFVQTSPQQLCHGDVLVVKRALCSRIMFGDLEGMPMLLPLDEATSALHTSSSHVLDIFQQLQCAFDSCNLPSGDRVSFAGVIELSHSCTLEPASLPVVATLCDAWLNRMRGQDSLVQRLHPVATAVKELLPAPLSDASQTWGVRPHQSSSGWMATWRLWRAVANALHMSGILLPSLANHGFRMGELSPSNLAFAACPLPRGFSTDATLLQQVDGIKAQGLAAAISPCPSSALASPQAIKQEDGMQDCDAPTSHQASSKDGASSQDHESLASLIAECPPNLHSGIVQAVCRNVVESLIVSEFQRVGFSGFDSPNTLEMLYLVVHSFIFRRLAGSLALMHEFAGANPERPSLHTLQFLLRPWLYSTRVQKTESFDVLLQQRCVSKALISKCYANARRAIQDFASNSPTPASISFMNRGGQSDNDLISGLCATPDFFIEELLSSNDGPSSSSSFTETASSDAADLGSKRGRPSENVAAKTRGKK